MKKEIRTKILERWIAGASSPTFSEDEEKAVKEDLLALMVECGAVLDKVPHPLGGYYGEPAPVKSAVEGEVGAALKTLQVGVESMRLAITEGPIGEEGKRQFRKDIPQYEAAIRILTKVNAPAGSTAFFLDKIVEERNRQDAKWGAQKHGPTAWLAILIEELGEVAKAILEGDGSAYVKELVEVAAVAVATLECFSRGENELVSITALQLEVKSLRELLKMNKVPERKCRACGCTDERACRAGCYWVEPDLCSDCVEIIKVMKENK